MTEIIALIPAIPLLSFVVIATAGKLLPKKAVAFLGVGSVSISAILVIISGFLLFSAQNSGREIISYIYNWIDIPGFKAAISFTLDPLSLVFSFVITFVGALIHLYSVEFMKDDDGFARFFAYMNLFVGSMLILVLAGNLLLLYLGWEGVGLCSYLLIGFWYRQEANGYAARKAFIVTRIGDTAMIIGLFILYLSFGTLDLGELRQQLPLKWAEGSPAVAIVSLLLLGGAIGKSAQLPLQVWLPDAMAGPSPVSALIHAATMVTAGVYLITRTNFLFSLSPFVMTTIAVIGAATLLIAGFSALAQNDLKRILAYSTISQIGYMFLAMGVGAWSAAAFHFVIHAFFKALLFLAGGAVIHLLNDEHDIRRMGGLRKSMPLVFYTFLAGGASLSALPLVTAGFYSKDQILWLGWSSASGSGWLWLAGITGALLTSVYTFRMIFITFFGEEKLKPVHGTGMLMGIPLAILAFLSVAGGFLEIPGNLGRIHLFSDLFGNSLPAVALREGGPSELALQMFSAIVSLFGIWLAYRFFYKPSIAGGVKEESRLMTFFRSGWGFDRIYEVLFVRPVVWLSEIDRKDFTDKIYSVIQKGTVLMNSLLGMTQNGKLRYYALVFTVGLVIILAYLISS